MLWGDSALLWRGIPTENSLCGELLCLACCSACSLLVNSVLLVGAINLPGCCAVTLALLVYYCSALKGNPYRKLPIIQTELALPWLVAVLWHWHYLSTTALLWRGIPTENSNWASFALACCCAVTLALIVWTFALSWWITALPCIV